MKNLFRGRCIYSLYTIAKTVAEAFRHNLSMHLVPTVSRMFLSRHPIYIYKRTYNPDFRNQKILNGKMLQIFDV